MNILFIGKRFYTNRDALTEEYGRIYQLPFHWAKAGHNVNLWLIDYHKKNSIKKQHDSLSTTSTPVKTLSVFAHWLRGNYKTKDKFDLVVASGDCYIGLMGYLIAKSSAAKFVFDVYDKYDEFGGYIKPLGFDLFGFLLKKSHSSLFASRALMEQLGNSKTDFLVVNGIDASRFKNIDKNIARNKLNLNTEDFLIGYFGSMEPDRGIEDLVDAVQLLRNESLAIQLILGGNAPKGLNLDRSGINYLGNVPFDHVPFALAACDALAIPYRRSAFMDAGASNKIAEAIACTRPIVATRTPNLTANFSLQATMLDAYLAEPSNPNSLASAIKHQLTNPVLVPQLDNIYWVDIANQVLKHFEGLINE